MMYCFKASLFSDHEKHEQQNECINKCKNVQQNNITRLHSDGTERSKSISFPFHVRSQNIFIE